MMSDDELPDDDPEVVAGRKREQEGIIEDLRVGEQS